MTIHERMTCVYEHREPDRCPIVDLPWPSTLERWHREGLPADADWIDYVGADRVEAITVDNSPRFPVQVLEETDEYIIHTNEWGLTKKDFHDLHSTPHRLDYRVTDPESWAEAKERMQPDRSRVDWDRLEREFPKWREEGTWITASFWYGFEVTYSHMVGPTLFYAMVEQPEWVKDMVDTYLDVCIDLFEMVWDAGYHFDQVNTWNDMGFKGKQFMSVEMYRDLFKPADRRLADRPVLVDPFPHRVARLTAVRFAHERTSASEGICPRAVRIGANALEGISQYISQMAETLRMILV